MSTESSAHDDLNDGPSRRTWRSYLRWSFWCLLFVLASYIGWAGLWIRHRGSLIEHDTFLADSVAIVFPKTSKGGPAHAAPFPLNLFGETGDREIGIWFMTSTDRPRGDNLKPDELAMVERVNKLYPESVVAYSVIPDDYILAMMRAVRVAKDAGIDVSGDELEAAGWKPGDDAEAILGKARTIRPPQ